MDESIQGNLLTERNSRRLTFLTRPLVRSALIQIEKNGTLLRNMRLVDIASAVHKICGVEVSDTSVRNVIAEAGLEAPPKGRPRWNSPGQADSDLDVKKEELGRVCAQVAIAKHELESIQAAITEARNEMRTTGEFWAAVKDHMRQVSMNVIAVNSGFAKVETITRAYTEDK